VSRRPILVSIPGLVAGAVSGGITTRVGFPAAGPAGEEEAGKAAGRQLLARLLRRDPSRMAWLKQVHSDRVLRVEDPGLAGDADAMVTREDDLALLIAVADCGPVLLHDPQTGVIAAAHAGWRGTVSGVCERTVEAMIEAGADVERIRAWIGPCIGPAQFEVGEEVAAQFDGAFVDRTQARPHVDLPAAIAARLLEAGLNKKKIRNAGQCTVELEDRYWSYRRDGGICGRQFAWIVRSPAATTSSKS